MTNALIGSLSFGTTLAAIAAISFSTPTSAQAARANCPLGYEILIDNQCIDYETGYIVQAPVTLASPRYTANCRQGYEILIDNQCIDYETGYIEFANDTTAGASQMARK